MSSKFPQIHKLQILSPSQGVRNHWHHHQKKIQNLDIQFTNITTAMKSRDIIPEKPIFLLWWHTSYTLTSIYNGGKEYHMYYVCCRFHLLRENLTSEADTFIVIEGTLKLCMCKFCLIPSSFEKKQLFFAHLGIFFLWGERGWGCNWNYQSYITTMYYICT